MKLAAHRPPCRPLPVQRESLRSGVQTVARAGLAIVLACAWPSYPAQAADNFQFALIGDLPYNRADEQNLRDVLDDIGRSQSAFVIHLGDIKSGSEHCGDALLERRISLLEASSKPLVLAVGDNEWTDCHRRPAGSFDPVERLNWLRKRVFAAPRSLGQSSLTFTQQFAVGTDPSPQTAPTPPTTTSEAGTRPPSAGVLAGLPENTRWHHKGVLFITFNVPGSNNNYWGQYDAAHPRNAEFAQRRLHNENWLRDSVALARAPDIQALVVAFQGNPFERDSGEQQSQLRDGFREWRQVLASQLKLVGKPVLLVHGDTHTHRIDSALQDEQGQTLRNVTRLETFGYPFTRNWVEVTVDLRKAKPFDIAVRRLLQAEGD